MTISIACARCGAMTRIEYLDAKPSDLQAFIDRTPEKTQRAGLQLAADEGAEFDRLECSTCYGPEYATVILPEEATP